MGTEARRQTSSILVKHLDARIAASLTVLGQTLLDKPDDEAERPHKSH
jgi:hypothetical protein